MTVAVAPAPHPSYALERIRRALERHAPYRLVPPTEADLVVLLVIGRRDHTARAIRWHHRRGRRVALVQVVWQSSLVPDAASWAPVWDAAVVVWSTYRLPTPKLYHAPFGLDPVFRLNRIGVASDTNRPIGILTSGPGWLQESVREVHAAARAVGQLAVHLGPSLGRPLVRLHQVPDPDLVTIYGACRYVSGLRRCEGFEFPAAEGLACGARPLLFDQPHYRDWYGDWADYVPEGSRPNVQAAVAARLSGPYRPVTPTERTAARRVFAWPPHVQGFWERAWTP